MSRTDDMTLAEKVMGYQWMTNRYTPGKRFLVGPNEARFVQQSEAVTAPLTLPLADHPAVTAPQYSTSIEDAMMLVAKLTADDEWGDITMAFDLRYTNVNGWMASFTPRNGETVWATGETAQASIVQAALKALGSKTDVVKEKELLS